MSDSMRKTVPEKKVEAKKSAARKSTRKAAKAGTWYHFVIRGERVRDNGKVRTMQTHVRTMSRGKTVMSELREQGVRKLTISAA
jgi:hypothetical protein